MAGFGPFCVLWNGSCPFFSTEVFVVLFLWLQLATILGVAPSVFISQKLPMPLST